ncbi:MAG: hypothetical protein M3Q51_08670, partial [Pseudomonadota bacterium]|nr:hypothetical protein [Pseudomonadota bacterium]
RCQALVQLHRATFAPITGNPRLHWFSVLHGGNAAGITMATAVIAQRLPWQPTGTVAGERRSRRLMNFSRIPP